MVKIESEEEMLALRVMFFTKCFVVFDEEIFLPLYKIAGLFKFLDLDF